MEHLALTGQSQNPKFQSDKNKGKQLRNLEGVHSVFELYYNNTANIGIPELNLKLNPEFLPNPPQEEVIIDNALEAYLALDAIYQTLSDDQEHFIMLCLRGGGHCIGYKVVTSGGLTYVLPDTGVVYRYGLLFGASELILAHNHPSGGLKPSIEDMTMTKDLIKGGQAVGLEVIEHIIYAHDGYTSIRERYRSLWR